MDAIASVYVTFRIKIRASYRYITILNLLYRDCYRLVEDNDTDYMRFCWDYKNAMFT